MRSIELNFGGSVIGALAMAGAGFIVAPHSAYPELIYMAALAGMVGVIGIKLMNMVKRLASEMSNNQTTLDHKIVSSRDKINRRLDKVMDHNTFEYSTYPGLPMDVSPEKRLKLSIMYEHYRDFPELFNHKEIAEYLNLPSDKKESNRGGSKPLFDMGQKINIYNLYEFNNVSVKEIAERLGCGETVIYNAINEIKAMKEKNNGTS